MSGVLAVGDEVGSYRVASLLGRGGTAEVYAVRHALSGMRFALKVMTAVHEELAARVQREASAITALRHPCVVQLHGFLSVEGSPALLLELVDGPDLHQWLVGPGREASLDTRLGLFAGALRGVAAAHEQGLVHRDLKLANVLLAPTRTGHQPKVADFGMAKLLTPTQLQDHLTRTGTVMGTLGYMAPEQMADSKHVDHRADIWALGCMLYELASARAAFPGTDLPTVYKRARRALYLPLHEVRADAPFELATAVSACLDPDPAGRPQTCGELARLLAPSLPGAFEQIDGSLPAAAHTVERQVPGKERPETLMPSMWELDEDW